MTIEQLHNFYDAQPFKPFVMHLADGREIPVHHRDFMMSAPNGRTVAVYQPDNRLNVVDLLLVTDVEVKPAGNGARRRKR